MVSADAAAGAPRTAAATRDAKAWRREMVIGLLPPGVLIVFCRSPCSGWSGSSAHLRDSGACEFDELHRYRKMLRQRGDGCIRVALANRFDDRGVLRLDIARLADFAADREPAVAFALLVQHVAETEQPWRTAGVDQRAMKDAVTNHPLFVVNARLIGILVGHGLERIEGGL